VELINKNVVQYMLSYTIKFHFQIMHICWFLWDYFSYNFIMHFNHQTAQHQPLFIVLPC